MEKKSIKEAIVQVLKKANGGLSSREITDKITDQKLYNFKSTNPHSIVNSTIRKSCVDIELKLSKKDRIFKRETNGNYKLKDS